MKQQAAANCRRTICHVDRHIDAGTRHLDSGIKRQAAAICHIFIPAGSAIMHTVKQTNKKDIKNENRQKKRSRQILQRPPEDAHCAKAHDGGNMERNQRHPISGVRSFGPGRQGRAAGQGSVRSIQKYKISLSWIRGHWPRIFLIQLVRQIVAGTKSHKLGSLKLQATSPRIPDSSFKQQALKII